MSVPLGGTEENPFRLAIEGVSHEHVQLGTGTWNPVATADARLGLGGFSLGAYGLAVLPFYESGEGYQAGRRFGAGLLGATSFGLTRWSFRLGGEVSAESAERWDGQIMEADGNRGRVDVLATAGAGLHLGGGVHLTASAKVPIYTHVVGGQLEYPVVLELGLARSFDLWGEHGHAPHHHDPHHGHDHPAAGPEADFAGLDVRSIADRGEAVDLVPVPGKITVFDFWATWCVPCRDLDRRVADLMRRHPGRIAIRKLDVETWDRPAARRYLGRAESLPHVRVHRADGSFAFARSGDPADIVAAIESLLR